MSKQGLRWEVDRKYSTWDVSNYQYLWEKAILDYITQVSDLPDDDARHVTAGMYKYYPIEDIKDRKIIATLIKDAGRHLGELPEGLPNKPKPT
jgi:hypothetical protein